MNLNTHNEMPPKPDELANLSTWLDETRGKDLVNKDEILAAAAQLSIGEDADFETQYGSKVRVVRTEKGFDTDSRHQIH